MKLYFSEITCVDVELSNICNLACPLCASKIGIDENKVLQKKHFADVVFIAKRISMFKNLKTVHIAGSASEPTLHPNLLEFIDILKKQNLTMNLYTNGTINNDYFWNALGLKMPKNSNIIFTIAGTTQHLHNMYRVDSNLKQLLKNASIVDKAAKRKLSLIQYIRFQFNKRETIDQISKFLDDFRYCILHTDTIYERMFFNKIQKNNGICSDVVFQAHYCNYLKQLVKKTRKNILCSSLQNKVVQIDPFGDIYPCIAYRLFSQDKFEFDDYFDYNSILAGKYDFCFECDKENVNFLQTHNRDAFCMCNNTI